MAALVFAESCRAKSDAYHHSRNLRKKMEVGRRSLRESMSLGRRTLERKTGLRREVRFRGGRPGCRVRAFEACSWARCEGGLAKGGDEEGGV